MSRRKKSGRRKTKKRSPTKRKSHPNGTALLTVDQEPILKKALAACRRLRTELHKKQERLTHFEEVEKDAYSRWLNSNFGVELTRIREMREESDDLDFIIGQLRMCVFYMPENLKDVYEELFRRKKEGTLHLFVPPESEEDEDDDEYEEEDEFDDELDAAFDSFFKDVFGEEDDWEEDDEFDDFRRSGNQRPVQHAPKPQTHEQAALKSLYRSLAKRLHPDRSDLEEMVQERRWHELQVAYQQGNMEALQHIEAVCDMDKTGLNAELGLARLSDLAAYHQSHLRPIRQALRAAKRHIAFAFTKADTTILAREIRRDFKHIQRDLKDRLTWLHRVAEDFLWEANRLNPSTQATDYDPLDDSLEEPPQSHRPSPAKTEKTDARQMQFF